MPKLTYHHVLPIDREDAEKEFASDDPARIIDALLSLTYHDPDGEWVQDRCIRFTDHPDKYVRKLAGLCFGHLARIHRELDIERILPILISLKKDPSIAEAIEDAFEDIETFMKKDYRAAMKKLSSK